jgi:hypothetical protein
VKEELQRKEAGKVFDKIQSDKQKMVDSIKEDLKAQ